jgi:N6-adenosine-specific RNA methylase IME4
VLEHGDTELVKAVERGDVDVKFGAQLAGKPKKEQAAVVRRIQHALKESDGKAVNPRQVLRSMNRDEAVRRIEQEPQPMPAGPFRVIVADPPWRYDVREDDGTHRGATDYATMSVEDIAALPVLERAADDAVLWMWITNAHMIEGAHVPILKAWGFEGKTILTWVKDRIGAGNYLRNKTEHCILATRGRATVVLTNEDTVLHAPRTEHSRKPPAFYERVEKMCPGSKLELFAREPRVGWQVWGCETDKFAGPAKVPHNARRIGPR